jgi:hypothetical protein
VILVAVGYVPGKIVHAKGSVLKNDETGANAVPNIGWSDFARGRHVVDGKHSWFEGSDEELLARMRAGWADRRPGQGRGDLSQVVIVPVEPAGFVGTSVQVDGSTPLRAHFDRRQPGEEGFIRVTAEGEREPVLHAAIVLYSADTLLQNGGTRSTECDWEIVCLLAGPREDEPMDPLTMARNYLRRAGGTFADYSAQEFAEAIWYWSQRANVHCED